MKLPPLRKTAKAVGHGVSVAAHEVAKNVEQLGRPPANYRQTEKYPCGCIATGGADLPAYCPEHDKEQTAAAPQVLQTPAAPPATLPEPEPALLDRRGVKFDAKIHARDESGNPKTDSLGHFILSEHDYQTPKQAHYQDTFRHGQAPKDDAPDAT